MIKKIILPIIAILMLSSCANKFSVQKRKYTKGYYFATSNSNNSKTNNADVVKHNKAKNLETKATALDISGQEKQIIEQPIINVENSYISTNLKKQNKKVSIITSAAKTSFNTLVTKEFKTLNVTKTNISNAKKGENSVNSVLLVVLCIFIPFLAVFLFENKITNNFWLDLILCILFYLPGIVYAFLVCFAGVSI